MLLNTCIFTTSSILSKKTVKYNIEYRRRKTMKQLKITLSPCINKNLNNNYVFEYIKLILYVIKYLYVLCELYFIEENY